MIFKICSESALVEVVKEIIYGIKIGKGVANTMCFNAEN